MIMIVLHAIFQIKFAWCCHGDVNIVLCLVWFADVIVSNRLMAASLF